MKKREREFFFTEKERGVEKKSPKVRLFSLFSKYVVFVEESCY